MLVWLLYLFFFFKDTATAEIYTYCHPLSLHAALPICDDGERIAAAGRSVVVERSQVAVAAAAADGEAVGGDRAGAAEHQVRAIAAVDDGGADDGIVAGLVDGVANLRSEEHTSELQSLMRTSFAIFCLKKKTTTT